jgi:CheY-like chemotaxis protein
VSNLPTRILLVEDDDDKLEHVIDFLKQLTSDLTLHTARSLQSGLQAILGAQYELVILDMTMPTFDISESEDGGRPQAYGGRELLRHMQRQQISTKAVVLTGFEQFGEGNETQTLAELDLELRKSHAGQYLGAIHYNLMDDLWQQQLRRALEGKDPTLPMRHRSQPPS